jgi:hypothetical protein
LAPEADVEGHGGYRQRNHERRPHALDSVAEV